MIEITQAGLKAALHYDPETGVFIRLVGRSNLRGCVAGGIDRESGYWVISLLGKQWLAHRMAWLYVYGYLPAYIDHINRVRSDNRIDNLRDVPHWQNIHNSKTRTDNTSGHRGVHFYKPYQRWQVYINVQGKRYTLGYKDSFDDAVAAYEQASSDLETGVPVGSLRSSFRTSPLRRHSPGD